MFPILEVSGTPRERGRQYGHLARDRVRTSIATYGRLFAYCGMSWDEAQRKALRYRDVIAATSPALLEEIAGIAAGANVAESEILALNARTEILPPTYPAEPSPAWSEARGRNRMAGVPDWGECTALAVLPEASDDGKMWLAQNWDWFGWQRSALVVLSIVDDHGRSALTLTEAGMLAKIGLNDRGFGLGLNILRSVDDGREPGVPVHVLLRHLLDCDDVESALRTARALKHGASSNIPVACAAGADGTAGEAASIEVSPRGVAVVRATAGTLAHTNHYLDAGQAIHAAPLNALASTEQRLACARRHATRGNVGRDALFTLLRDMDEGAMSVCRVPDPSLPPEVRVETVAGVAMNLTDRVMWIAPDIPSRVAFEPVMLRGPAAGVGERAAAD